MESYFKKRPKPQAKGSKSPEVCEARPASPPAESATTTESRVLLSRQEITKHLLSSLTDPSNPITHSDIHDRTQQVIALATGHQTTDERRDMRLVHIERTEKLSAQRPIAQSGSNLPLSRTKIYLNGYLQGTTDIEMKRLITEGGGEVLHTPSARCTHIVTSQPLSGSKTHKLLTSTASVKKYVVRPEWVFDTLKANKRQPERTYIVTRHSSTLDRFVGGSKQGKQ